MDRAEVVAHRGASAQAPEHTLEAFDLALAQGADMLELDVRATADGEPVIVHDPTLRRTAGDARQVAALRRGDLARLPAAVRPLTLEQVLERYAARTRLLVELKDPAPPLEDAVIAALRRHGVARSVVVQSFDGLALRRLAAQAPWLAVAPLCRRAPTSRGLRAIAGYARGVGVCHHALDAAAVARLHAGGLAVRAWTVNDPREIDRLLGLGVDGVITDVPDVALGRAAARAAAGLASAA